MLAICTTDVHIANVSFILPKMITYIFHNFTFTYFYWNVDISIGFKYTTQCPWF